MRKFADPRPWVLLAFLALIGSALSFAQATRPTPAPKPHGGFQIAGMVVNAKTSQPLARVQVSVTNTKNSKDTQSVVTSDDGRFQFQVAAGKYSLQGSKKGFLTSAYEQHENFWTGIVTGTGLDTETLTLRLPPTALITGTVTDEIGEPVRGATITVYRENHFAGVARIEPLTSVATDDLGTYEVPSLSAGTHFVSATAQPWYAEHAPSSRADAETVLLVDHTLDVAFPVSYYKAATESDDATPIPIRPGDHVEVDFQMSPVPALHLVLHSSADASGQFNVPTLQRLAFDGAAPPSENPIEQISPGVFELIGLAAGRYTLEAHNSADGSVRGFSAIDLTNDGQEVDLAAGAPAASVKMTVQLQGLAQLPSRLFLGLRDEKGKVGALSEVNDKGEVEFTGVVPGKYDVIAGPARKAYSVFKITSEDVVSSGHSLSVAAGASLPVSVVLVGGAVTAEGFVQKAGKPAAAAMVVLVPNHPESNLELFRRDQSDLDGSFALAGIIPGTYTILAIENGWDLDWAKPAVLESYRRHGQKIVVGENGKDTMRLPGPVEAQPRP